MLEVEVDKFPLIRLPESSIALELAVALSEVQLLVEQMPRDILKFKL